MGRPLRDNERSRCTAGEVRAMQDEADGLRLKIHELESIIWDGTRQLADLEARLQRASELCARPRGVCLPIEDPGDGRVG